MDGNGRWAKQRQLPRIAGHQSGVKTAKAIIQAAGNLHIPVLSLFAFGQENWRRPRPEVDFLMQLFLETLQKELADLHQNQVRFKVIGDLSTLSPALLQQIQQAERVTESNQGMQLLLAVNYSGRWDLLQAMQKIVRSPASQEITSEVLEQHLVTAGIPEPDLLIRTSGEQRISNFYLWQLAYTELYFSDKLWPDFSEEDFTTALTDYAQRQRRFGYTNDQLAEPDTRVEI
jgi:undecaprenyl diphosphate synthase